MTHLFQLSSTGMTQLLAQKNPVSLSALLTDSIAQSKHDESQRIVRSASRRGQETYVLDFES